MRHAFWLGTAFLLVSQFTLADQPPSKVLATGLHNPQAVVVGPDGKVYVAVAGEPGKELSGAIMVLDKGKATPFVSGLENPRGFTTHKQSLFVVDKNAVWRVDVKGKSAGKAESVAATSAFPRPPINLTNLAVDYESGTLYVSDAGDKTNKGGAIFRIAAKGGFGKGPGGKAPDAKGATPTVVTDQTKWPALQRPGALAMDGQNHLLMVDGGNGTLYRIKLADGSAEQVAEGFGTGNGMTWDRYGRLFVSDGKSGKVYVIGRPGEKPVVLSDNFQDPADIGFDPNNRQVVVADKKAGTVSSLAAQIPGAEVDESPLPIQGALAFSKMQWTGFQSENKAGKQAQFRPILLTHAGDGSNRVFVATQQGVVHVFPNNPNADKSKVFLDIQKKVIYNDAQNEEGFLGMAFHPKYKTNGEFFVFYTLKQGKNQHTNLVVRFRVSKDDPDRADPASEEELMRFDHKNFNHDGGTICFGPDGYLYITTGDGGSANDPDKNGQNLNTLLAKVLRIDVDHKDPGKNYAIPKDNPFVDVKNARPEVWAYGLRNLWRMAFDRKTGTLWAGEVGQNLFEEINIIVKGGNYGWSVRESFHPFGAKGSGPRPDLIDPIWEYHHSLGLCIIGGNVYRGKNLPELDGAYIYADYLTGKVWALRYDEKAKRVTANRPITTPGQPILSFGEDEQGETYFLISSPTGKGVYQLQRAAGK